jgi:peptidoglycan lytic transglycosylase
MRSRIATLLAVPAFLLCTAAPAVAQDGGGTGGATPDDAPAAPLTVGGLMGGDVKWSATVAGPGNVSIQRLDPTSGAWIATATATAADDGTFEASWLADALGDESVRAVLDGSDPASAPVATATVFRGARATWYGPGFYGHRLACGGRLRTSTMGVAHRKLPCGTPVQVFYDGRSVTVPVVDRGPFANGASYDLTAAVAQALGVKETTRVGVLPKPAAATAKAKGKAKAA